MKNWTKRKEDILDIPLPIKTHSYSPVPHSVFLEEINIEIEKQGYKVIEESYLTINDGKVLTGNLRIGNNNTFINPTINFTNSYNKMRKAELRGCATVLICKNGMMGSIGGGYSHKHNGNVLKELREQIVIIVSNLESEFLKLEKNMQELQKIKLNKDVISTLIGDMFINEELINTTQLGILSKELKFSEHFKGDTAWDFYNNVTESFKDNHPMNYDKQHIKFHTYCSDKFGLTGRRGLYGTKLKELNYV